MSLDSIYKIIENCGIKRAEVEVYVYLAKVGPQKSIDITINLKIPEQKLYHILENLRKRGVVTRDSKRPNVFLALSFEELLDQYIKQSIEKAQTIKETKEELLASWRNMTELRK